MSSKILSGAAADPAQAISWRTIGPAAPQAHSGQDAAATAPAQDVAAEWAQKLRDLERSTALQVQQATADAFARGEAAGREMANRELSPIFERLARSIEEISGLRPRLRKQAEQDVVRLSLAIARRILHRELAIDPDALLGLVKAAIQKIDARDASRIRIHPRDADRLRASLDSIGLPQAVEVVSDPTLEKGAVLFETARGWLDASVDTQLEEIGRGFSDFLERRNA